MIFHANRNWKIYSKDSSRTVPVMKLSTNNFARFSNMNLIKKKKKKSLEINKMRVFLPNAEETPILPIFYKQNNLTLPFELANRILPISASLLFVYLRAISKIKQASAWLWKREKKRKKQGKKQKHVSKITCMRNTRFPWCVETKVCKV